MGMGGVQRTAKFTKYLQFYGWQPHVLTVDSFVYLASDSKLLEEVQNAGVIIHRTGSKAGSNGKQKVVKFKNDSSRKFLSNLSQTFLIPDSKILWKTKALALAERIIEEEQIELIFSTAPPYTDFVLAAELKEKFGLPVILDYRDSWIDCPNNFYLTPFHKRKHKQLEADALKHADGIVTINDRIKELIIERYPFVSENLIRVISQGFDPEDFEAFSNETPPHDKLRLTYLGGFLNYYTPKHFLDALNKVLSENPRLKGKIEAMFVGTFPDDYKRYAENIGLSDSIVYKGYTEHAETAKLLMQSHVLWMMINRTERSDLHSTVKLYEYIGARKPIIASVPDGVARESLKHHGAVKLTEPDDVNAIADAIIYYYGCFETNSFSAPAFDFVSGYDRKKLTAELAGIFDNVASKRREKASTY